jgi:hypothetical protein
MRHAAWQTHRGEGITAAERYKHGGALKVRRAGECTACAAGKVRTSLLAAVQWEARVSGLASLKTGLQRDGLKRSM